MSCTSGFGEDECGTVLRDVWLFLDNELDPERRAAVQRHLDDCSPCLEEAGLDSKLKDLLARKCGGDRAPAHLRERIVAGLVQWRSTTASDGQGTRVQASSVTMSWESVDVDPSRTDGGPTGH
jgi:mycothiol system anti-sigma-R factor